MEWSEIGKTIGESLFLSFRCPACNENIVIRPSTPAHPSPIEEGQQACACETVYHWKISFSSDPPFDLKVMQVLKEILENSYNVSLAKNIKLEIRRS